MVYKYKYGKCNLFFSFFFQAQNLYQLYAIHLSGLIHGLDEKTNKYEI